MAKLEYTLSDKQLINLGKIHSCFGAIEQLLQILILATYKLDITHGRLLIGRMDTPQKLDVLKEAINLLIPSSVAAKKLAPLYSRIRSLADKRNRLTHAAWSRSTKSDDSIAVAFKHWGKFENMIRASQLPSILKEVECIQNELLTVVQELYAEGYKV